MDKNSNFKVGTERPQKLVGMVVRSNDKLKIHFILRHTGAQQVTTLTFTRTSRSFHFKAYRSTAGYDFNI